MNIPDIRLIPLDHVTNVRTVVRLQENMPVTTKRRGYAGVHWRNRRGREGGGRQSAPLTFFTGKFLLT